MGKLTVGRRLYQDPLGAIEVQTRRVTVADTVQERGYFQVGSGSTTARMDGIDPTWRFWAGAASPGNAPFAVRGDGFVRMTSGCISGSVLVGSGDESVVLSGTDTTYRIWAGASAAGSANFRVDKNGVLYATGACISGSLSGSSGEIGGWAVGASTLTGGSVTLDSDGRITAGSGTRTARLDALDSTWRLYVGSTTGSDAPFRVDEQGNMVADSGSFTGDIISQAGSIGGWSIGANTLTGGNVKLDASGSVAIGASTGRYLKLLGSGPQVESSNYNSGYSGFHLSPSLLEVQNLIARGMIRTIVFQKDTVSAIGGNLMVLDGDILTTCVPFNDTAITISGSTTFKVNDILRIKGQSASGDILEEWLLVTDATLAPKYTVTRNVGSTGCPNWPIGATVVNYGPSGSGGLLLTSSLTNSPYLSIFTHNGSPWNGVTEKARLGYLGGISAASGWGLWTENGYFDGTLHSASGTIGGWTIGSDTLIGGNIKLDASGSILVGSGSDVAALDATHATWRLWAGDPSPTLAPFRVDKDGNLVAQSGSFTGDINAQAGSLQSLAVAGSLKMQSGGRIITNNGTAPFVELSDEYLTIIDTATTVPASPLTHVRNTAAPGSPWFGIGMTNDGVGWLINVDDPNYPDGITALAFERPASGNSGSDINIYLRGQNRIRLEAAASATRLILFDSGGVQAIEMEYLASDLTFDTTGTGSVLFQDFDIIKFDSISASSPKLQFPAAHYDKKIELYAGGGEAIGTRANEISIYGDKTVFYTGAGASKLQIDSSGNITNNGVTRIHPVEGWLADSGIRVTGLSASGGHCWNTVANDGYTNRYGQVVWDDASNEWAGAWTMIPHDWKSSTDIELRVLVYNDTGATTTIKKQWAWKLAADGDSDTGWDGVDTTSTTSVGTGYREILLTTISGSDINSGDVLRWAVRLCKSSGTGNIYMQAAWLKYTAEH